MHYNYFVTFSYTVIMITESVTDFIDGKESLTAIDLYQYWVNIKTYARAVDSLCNILIENGNISAREIDDYKDFVKSQMSNMLNEFESGKSPMSNLGKIIENSQQIYTQDRNVAESQNNTPAANEEHPQTKPDGQDLHELETGK